MYKKSYRSTAFFLHLAKRYNSMSKDLQDHVCDEQRYASIYKLLASDLHNFLYYNFGANLNPADKVQEAFIKLWKNCDKVPPSKAKSYLFTIGNNMMLNDIKHQKVKLKFQQLPTRDRDHYDPEFLMQEKEYLLAYQNALSKLSEGQREVFLLNRIEGKRHKEIAELLNISRKAVEKRLYTALEKLRKDIKEI